MPGAEVLRASDFESSSVVAKSLPVVHRWLTRVLCLSLAILLCPVSVFPSESSSHHTAIELLANVRSIHPGDHFLIGVRLTMEKGWHTYWKNPGESGLSTEIHWALPASIAANPIEWPIPEKHLEAGDILTYGYSGETMLLVSMTASSSLRPGESITLTGQVTWLECERTCVPGKATVSLVLPVTPALPQPDHEKLFQRYQNLLPATLPTSLELIPSFKRQEIAFVVSGVPPGGSRSGWDFYPEILPNAIVGRPVVTSSGNSVSFTLPVTTDHSGDSARDLRGILMVPDSTGRLKGYSVNIRLSPEAIMAVSGTTGVLDRKFNIPTSASPQSLLISLLFALVGGFLLNIMPCVLPVIALKIFGLVKMAGDQPARVKVMGLFFALGILVSFLALALIVILLQAAGRQIGWGFQFQEPLFVIAMSVVVFAFGLSLFGVFEVRLPAKAVEGVGTVLQKHEGKGVLTSFWEGVFATILATPCTAPFLGAALGFAFAQPPWIILLIFATVAIGMALPYIVLTARPAWMRFIPKPGEWMVTAKQIMGFLLMATLVWLLYILGQQLGVEGITWTAALLVVVAVACWMIGRFITLSSTRTRASVIWGIAALLIVGGYVSFVAPLLAERAQMSSATDVEAADSGGIAWERFSPDILESHLKARKAVFVDFTADWCLTCKVNEKAVMARNEVVTKFKTSGIVAMRADWTNGDQQITKLLAKFGRSGVPLYVIFPEGKPDDPIVLPEVITPSIVINAIDEAFKGTR